MLSYHTVADRLPGIHLDRIEISWRGRPSFSGSLPDSFTDTYTAQDAQQPIVEAVDLDADGRPEIVVHTYTGGAHCCAGSVIYGYDPRRKRITYVAHDWQNGGYLLKKISGHRVLISDDQRFAYAFASFARSGMPIQIWAYTPVALHDVTRCYPSLIADDAQRWWKAAEEEKGDPEPETLGFLTAYAGDEYMLGRKTQALTEVSRFGSQVTPKYLLSLQEFLHDTGYESQRRPPCHKA